MSSPQLVAFDAFSNLTLNGRTHDNPFASVPTSMGWGFGIGTTALGALHAVQTGQSVPIVVIDSNGIPRGGQAR